MTKVTKRPSKVVGVKLQESHQRMLRDLVSDTGLSKSGVFKLGLAELAKKRLPKIYGDLGTSTEPWR